MHLSPNLLRLLACQQTTLYFTSIQTLLQVASTELVLQQLLEGQAQQAKQIEQLTELLRGQRPAPPAVVPRHYHQAAHATFQGATGRLLEALPLQITPQVAQKVLIAGSLGAASISYGAVTHQYQRRKAAAFQEFAAWYTTMMQALGIPRSPYAALPEDLVLYHQQHWIPVHGETMLAGKLWPAPGSLTSNFSMLSAIFEARGRTGLHSSETQVRLQGAHGRPCAGKGAEEGQLTPFLAALQTGNPVKSKVVADYKEGYARYLTALGYATTSATHFRVEKLEQLVALVSAAQGTARDALDWADKAATVKYLLLERDMLGICGPWECYLRGHDMGRLTKLCVQDRHGWSLFPQLVEEHYTISPGQPYQLAPNGTKTTQRQRAGVVRLEARPAGQEELCFLRRLQRFQQECKRGSISESDFLLRPEAADHQDFKPEAMTSCALNKRFQSLLRKHGLYEGETLHGIRRGTMQHAVNTGSTPAEVGARALQVTPSVTQMYLDTSRETYGPQRQSGAWRQPSRPTPY